MGRPAITGEADGERTIRNRTFEDCDILGPAMIVPVGTDNTATDCSYQAADLGTTMRAGPSGPVVLVIGCNFRRCSFAADFDARRLLDAQAASNPN